MRTRVPIASARPLIAALAIRPLITALTVACALLLVPTGRARAATPLECDGVSFPEHVQAGGETLTLNGLGLRKATIFGIKVYVGALYLAHRSTSADTILSSRDPAQIELRFVFHATQGQMRSAWQEGFEKSAPGQLPQLQARITQLESWMTSVGSGQRMTFVRLPGVGIQYSLDGITRGTIAGDDFARAFLAIWLGPSPPNPELRSGLLGGPCR